jgi:ribosome-binding protein aMBF1 (putative translation factor)
LYLFVQEFCFNEIFGAPTAINISPSEDVQGTMTSNFGRRVSQMARRASASVISVAAPAIRKTKSSMSARVKSMFFDDATVREIPQAVETNRALAGMSISNASTLGPKNGGNRQISMDIESGVSLSHRSSTAMQRRYRTLLSTGTDSGVMVGSRTSKRSQVLSVSPQMSLGMDGPSTAAAVTDPLMLCTQFEDEFQRYFETIDSREAREVYANQWG